MTLYPLFSLILTTKAMIYILKNNSQKINKKLEYMIKQISLR